MLAEGNIRTGFVETSEFKVLLTHLPVHLHPLMILLFTAGCRVGAALQITWDMVSPDARKIHLPANIVKNKKPITIPLTQELTAVLKKQFRKSSKPVFDATNPRRAWEAATVAVGFRDLLIHDLRRSGVRNLRNSGVDETVIMKNGGWQTRSVFIRYAIVSPKDMENAMESLQNNSGTLLVTSNA
jgi:integrase